jgi:hypothetical protein
MVIPAFLMALHMTLFLVNYHVEKGQLWSPRRFYENAPIAFTLWTLLLRWIYHGKNPVDRLVVGWGGNVDPEALTGPGQGRGPGIRMTGLPAVGGVSGGENDSGDLAASSLRS